MLTRDFKTTVRDRIARDGKFRQELARAGVECVHAGDPETGQAILRDYIPGTINSEEFSNPLNDACQNDLAIRSRGD